MRAILETLSEQQTAELGRRLAPLLAANDVVTLSGDLGAGKTAFVKGVAAGLGVKEPVVSPTFNIMLVHPGRLTLHHVDLYRLDTEAQLDDIDFFGTLEAGGVTFVEWGERFPHALPPDHLALTLSISGDVERRILVAPAGERADALATAWVESCPASGGGRA